MVVHAQNLFYRLLRIICDKLCFIKVLDLEFREDFGLNQLFLYLVGVLSLPLILLTFEPRCVSLAGLSLRS